MGNPQSRLKGMIMTSSILAVLPLLAVLLPFVLNYRLRKKLLKIPGPPVQNLLLGNLADIPKNQYEEMDHMVSQTTKYGQNGFYPFIMGPLPTLNAVGPNAVKEILSSSKHGVKSFIYDFIIPWLGTGLLTANGAKWKSRRRLTTPAFHFEVLQRFNDVMNEQSNVMIERIKEESSKDPSGKIEVFELITACALDIICETAMGKKIYAQKSTGRLDYVEAVFGMSGLIIERIKNPLLRSDFIYSMTSAGKQSKKNLKILHEFTLSVIQERKKLLESQKGHEEEEKKRRPAFLDILLQAEVEGQPLSDEDIREEVDTFMFEGHDTTSASLAWTINLIASHPEVQKRLQEEVDEIMGDEQDVSFEMLGNFKYLEMVTKESLRLYPSVPMISRVTTEDIQLQGYAIPQGTTVTINILALHRNPHVWGEDADKFNPERWVNDHEERDPYKYIPFSAGPRNCIGQKFAQNEEKILLAKILKNFDLESLNPKPHSYPELILRPIEGIWVNATPRKQKTL